MKTTKGGKRENAGRKSVSDKKVQISLYVENSKIEKLGGLDSLKEKIKEKIESMCKKK